MLHAENCHQISEAGQNGLRYCRVMGCPIPFVVQKRKWGLLKQWLWEFAVSVHNRVMLLQSNTTSQVGSNTSWNGGAPLQTLRWPRHRRFEKADGWYGSELDCILCGCMVLMCKYCRTIRFVVCKKFGLTRVIICALPTPKCSTTFQQTYILTLHPTTYTNIYDRQDGWQ